MICTDCATLTIASVVVGDKCVHIIHDSLQIERLAQDRTTICVQQFSLPEHNRSMMNDVIVCVCVDS